MTKKLIDDNKEKNTKLSKLQDEIKEKQLEAQRRKSVLETKIYGAQIEVITVLRDELKRKDLNTKAITKLETKVESLEQIVKENSKLLTKIETKLQSTENMSTKKSHSSTISGNSQEDDWLRDILENTPYESWNKITVHNAKQKYSQIKRLKIETTDLRKNIKLLPQTTYRSSKQFELERKQNELNSALKELGDLWSRHS